MSQYIYTPAAKNIVKNIAREMRAEVKAWQDPAHRRIGSRAISEMEGRIIKELAAKP